MPNPKAVIRAKIFYRKNIFPLLDHIVFYKKKHLLHFDSNSANESTNRGMKSHAAPTNPQHTLEKATKVLSHQARFLKTLARKANSTTRWSDQGQLLEITVSLIDNECAKHNKHFIMLWGLLTLRTELKLSLRFHRVGL